MIPSLYKQYPIKAKMQFRTLKNSKSLNAGIICRANRMMMYAMFATVEMLKMNLILLLTAKAAIFQYIRYAMALQK